MAELLEATPEQQRAEHEMEILVGNMLRVGVFVAAAVALIGGVFFLATHAHAVPDYRVFRGEPTPLRSLAGIAGAVRALNSAAIIQAGIVLLIATPVARVFLSLVAFARQRDRIYVVVTTIVLALLLYSLVASR